VEVESNEYVKRQTIVGACRARRRQFRERIIGQRTDRCLTVCGEVRFAKTNKLSRKNSRFPTLTSCADRRVEKHFMLCYISTDCTGY